MCAFWRSLTSLLASTSRPRESDLWQSRERWNLPSALQRLHAAQRLQRWWVVFRPSFQTWKRNWSNGNLQGRAKLFRSLWIPRSVQLVPELLLLCMMLHMMLVPFQRDTRFLWLFCPFWIYTGWSVSGKVEHWTYLFLPEGFIMLC